MTDQELIELVQTKPPEDLTPEEVALLRQRMPLSAELRAAVHEQLRIETYLGGTLGAAQVSVERIVSQAGAGRRRRWFFGGLLLIAVAIGLGVWQPWSARPEPRPIAQGSGAGGEESSSAADGHTEATSSEAGTESGPGVELDAAGAARLASEGDGSDRPSGDHPDAQAAHAAAMADGDARPLDERNEPWANVLEAGPPPPFEEAAFPEIEVPTSLSPDDIVGWLAPVQPPQLQVQRRRGAMVDGVARLRAPWRADVGLRMRLANHHGFRIHVIGEREAVTLQYFEHPQASWFAYQSQFDPGQAVPHPRALAGADNDRYRRSGEGSVLLQWGEGTVVLSRGDVRLLQAPLATMPRAVLFEGRCEWHEIAMLRVAGLPPDDVRRRPLVLKGDRPGDLVWSRQVPRGLQLRTLGDGSLELAATEPNVAGRTFLRLEEGGLYEVLLQLHDPQPGVGVFLGDLRGEPVAQAAFFRETQSGRTTLGALPPGQNRDTASLNPASQPMPLAGPQPWVRLVCGLGVCKIWISADGRHWARLPEQPQPIRRNGFATVGLFCGPGKQPRAIRLKRLEVRELSGLASLGPVELRERAAGYDESSDLGTWLAAVMRAQPEGVDADAWRRACAVKALAGSPSTALGEDLLRGLVQETIASTAPAADRLAALEDFALLYDAWAPPKAAEAARLYHRLGEILADQGDSRPFSQWASDFVRAPIWSSGPIVAFPPHLIRQELIAALAREDWLHAFRLGQRIQFWMQAPHPDRGQQPLQQALDGLAAWAMATAAEASRGETPAADMAAFHEWMARRGRRGRVNNLQTLWKHPLVEELSKEGYNILAEFEAALQSQAYEDACQIITQADAQRALGLLPDSKQQALLVSLGSAVTLAMRDYPPLREVMRREFGPPGVLRVREAIGHDDAEAVQAATVQYSGAEAASLAHVWLGDRALSSGEFTRALAHYQQALESAAADDESSLRARARLAAAMLGRDAESPPQAPVSLLGQSLSAEQFEQMTGEVRRHRAEQLAGGLRTVDRAPAPSPGAFAAAKWADFNGASQWEGRIPAESFDPLGRKFTLTPIGDRLYVSDSFQLNVYEQATARLLWSLTPDANVNFDHWAAVATRPAVRGDRVFIRRFARERPELLCLNAADGTLVWKSMVQGWTLASDPLWVQDELLVLAYRPLRDRTLQLGLLSFDPGSGQLEAAMPMVEIRDFAGGRLACQATVAGDRIVFAAGGCAAVCDSAGRIRWLRRQLWTPAAIDERQLEQLAPEPLIVGDRVLVSQPGVRVVQCLDLQTGRERWRHWRYDLRGLLLADDEFVVIETGSGLATLNAADGALIWHKAGDRSNTGAWLDGDGRLLHFENVVLGPDRQRPDIVWSNLADGREVARWPLTELEGKAGRVGPLSAAGDRVWLTAGQPSAKRTIHSLTAAAGAPAANAPPYPAAPRAESSPLIRWIPEALTADLPQTAAFAPGWLLTAGDYDRRRGRTTAAHNRPAIMTMARPRAPAVWVRKVDVPENGARLKLHAAHEGNQPWILEVQAGGQQLLRQPISAETAPSGWLEQEVDLAPFAGKTVWLVVSQHSQGKPADVAAFWGRLEVVAADGSPLAP